MEVQPTTTIERLVVIMMVSVGARDDAMCVHRDTDRDRSRDAIDITMKKNAITHHIERDVVDHFWLTSPP
jgi:hypothetical protein